MWFAVFRGLHLVPLFWETTRPLVSIHLFAFGTRIFIAIILVTFILRTSSTVATIMTIMPLLLLYIMLGHVESAALDGDGYALKRLLQLYPEQGGLWINAQPTINLASILFLIPILPLCIPISSLYISPMIVW